MDLDRIKDRFGGVWYDTWWCATYSWLSLHGESQSEWLMTEWKNDFFRDINSGWLEMYPTKPKTKEEKAQELLQSLLRTIL